MGAGAVVTQNHGRPAADRGDGKIDRQFARDKNQRRAAVERTTVIVNAAQLAELLSQIQKVDRVAIDTEADSLHSYREKLCLLQVSLPAGDFILDPLAGIDLAPLSAALSDKEIVLHGADFDLRLLRRSLNFTARRVFDTVIAARL